MMAGPRCSTATRLSRENPTSYGAGSVPATSSGSPAASGYACWRRCDALWRATSQSGRTRAVDPPTPDRHRAGQQPLPTATTRPDHPGKTGNRRGRRRPERYRAAGEGATLRHGADVEAEIDVELLGTVVAQPPQQPAGGRALLRRVLALGSSQSTTTVPMVGASTDESSRRAEDTVAIGLAECGSASGQCARGRGGEVWHEDVTGAPAWGGRGPRPCATTRACGTRVLPGPPGRGLAQLRP